MLIRFLEPKDYPLSILTQIIRGRVNESRFRQPHIEVAEKPKNSLSITGIRLRKSKQYHGQLPIPGWAHQFHYHPFRSSTCLEPLDWVGWNDLLNDLCDDLHISANIRTSFGLPGQAGRLYIRRGRLRRVIYKQDIFPADNQRDSERYFWNTDNDVPEAWQDCIGAASPKTIVPGDLYGWPLWRLRDAPEWEKSQ